MKTHRLVYINISGEEQTQILRRTTMATNNTGNTTTTTMESTSSKTSNDGIFTNNELAAIAAADVAAADVATFAAATSAAAAAGKNHTAQGLGHSLLPYDTKLFPSRLHNMLRDATLKGFDHIISWSKHEGDHEKNLTLTGPAVVSSFSSFVIHQPELLPHILSQYFRSSLYKTFCRRLQEYNFTRKKNIVTGKFHPSLRRKRRSGSNNATRTHVASISPGPSAPFSVSPESLALLQPHLIRPLFNFEVLGIGDNARKPFHQKRTTKMLNEERWELICKVLEHDGIMASNSYDSIFWTREKWNKSLKKNKGKRYGRSINRQLVD